jgi:hypothetical protein
MKTTINAEELRKLNACQSGFDTFLDVHGEKTVKFSQALESNGWNDIWWLIAEINGDLSEGQNRDLRLLACDYAEDVLYLYEKEYDDSRPRNAIEVSRRFAVGEATCSEMDTAARAARAAAGAARAAARAGAARAAARAARAAAGAAARAAGDAGDAAGAAGCAKLNWQTQQLMNLFIKWESEG